MELAKNLDRLGTESAFTVLAEAKKIENIQKNLKGKTIIKNIFVKNKIINFITK